MTFSLSTCTVAVADAAQNHSNSAQNVCRKKAAQISLVQVSQLEDILCADILLEYESFNFFIHIFTIIIRGPKYLNLTVPTQRFTAHGGLAYEKNKMDRLSKKPISMF